MEVCVFFIRKHCSKGARSLASKPEVKVWLAWSYYSVTKSRENVEILIEENV